MKTFSEFTTELSEAFGFGKKYTLKEILSKYSSVKVSRSMQDGKFVKVYVPKEIAKEFFENFSLAEKNSVLGNLSYKVKELNIKWKKKSNLVVKSAESSSGAGQDGFNAVLEEKE